VKSSRRVRFALTAAAVGLALGASGCSYMNPVQTHDFYQAADGTNASVTDANHQFVVGVRNAIVVVDSSKRGDLVASVVNYTDKDQTVELTGTHDGTTVFTKTLPLTSGQTVKIGPADIQDGGKSAAVQVGADDFPVATGEVMNLTLTVDGQDDKITLPVTGQSLEYYTGNTSAEKG
jgi:hypothetical protein